MRPFYAFVSKISVKSHFLILNIFFKVVSAIPEEIRNGNEKRTDYVGAFLALMFTGYALSPFVVLWLNAAGLEPFYFVFEEFLPSAYNRPNWILLMAFSVRFWMTWLIGLESLRIIGLFFGALFAGAHFFGFGTKMLSVIPDEEGECKWMFLQMRILFAHVEEVMSLLLMGLMVINQLSVVAFSWFVIKCRAYFSSFLLFTLCLIDLVVVSGTLFLLTAAGNIGAETESVMKAAP